MQDEQSVAWLGRKIGWGFSEGQRQEWNGRGPAAIIDQLVNPANNGIAARPDPFDGVVIDRSGAGVGIREGVVNWVDNAISSPRPLETLMEFFWHDFFAVSIRVVRPRTLMFDHMNLLARHATGNFSELLRDMTIDPSMLDFLDGGRSTKANPNENFARELLELYSVGVGAFTEADVKAASKALTGWRHNRRTGESSFVPRQHDDSEQTLLGVEGVNDVESTIDAALSHPATAPRVVDKIAAAILGPGYDQNLVGELSDNFASDWELKPVLQGLLELGTQGHAVPAILEPVAWYVTARKAPTSDPNPSRFRDFFRQSGQLPLFPPNVGGFPEPDAYLSTSATLARFNLASHLAQQSDRAESPVDTKAMTNDVAALADRLGLIDGFLPNTAAAIESLDRGSDRLAAALASPDLVVV